MRGKNEPTIHQKNLQAFMTEVYEIVNGVAPPIMNSLFNFAPTSIISETFRKSLQRIGRRIKHHFSGRISNLKIKMLNPWRNLSQE